LDLDTVYGRNKTIADILRVGEGGKLKVDTYLGTVFGRLPFTFSNLPPSQNSTGLSSDTSLLAQPRDQIQTAGDKRVADNVSLFLFHTLFLREHNRIAIEMSQSHPSMIEEMRYQKARSINIAQYQNIVLYEYLVSLLGGSL
jgi:peroxidase